MVAMLTTLPAGSQLDVYAAEDRDQARLVVDWARGLAARTPALAAALTIDAYKITAPNGSVLESLAAESSSAFGRSPVIAVLDEICNWTGSTNTPRRVDCGQLEHGQGARGEAALYQHER